VFLTGSAGRLAAVQSIAPLILGVPVVVPAPGDYAAIGAARQAAWALADTALPPTWPLRDAVTIDPGEDVSVGHAVRQQFAATRAQAHPELG
jgi:xylulokinase